MALDPITAGIDAAKTIINKIFPDKAEAMKINAQIDQASKDGNLEELKIIMAPFLAEAQSSDKYTSRARPSFFYVMYALILWCIPFGIVFAFNPAFAQQTVEGMTFYFKSIPTELWGVFGAGFVVYTGARSYWDKRNGSVK